MMVIHSRGGLAADIGRFKKMKKQNKDWEKQIKEICTFHSDEGTSGYCLSEEQFRKICDLVDKLLALKEKEVRDRKRREMLQKIECLGTTDINYKGLKIKGVLLNRGGRA